MNLRWTEAHVHCVLIARRSARVLGVRLEDTEHVLLTEDHELLAFDLDLGAAVFAEKDPIAGVDVELPLRTILEDLAIADGDDLALDGLFLGGIGNDDAAVGLIE